MALLFRTQELVGRSWPNNFGISLPACFVVYSITLAASISFSSVVKGLMIDKRILEPVVFRRFAACMENPCVVKLFQNQQSLS